MTSFKQMISTAAARLTANKDAKRQADARAFKAFGLVLIACAAMAPELAMAAPWDNTANQVLAMFTGGLTRTLAILGVIACGIAAFFGKLSWDWAIKIIVGVVLIFGSATIIDYIIAAATA